MPLHSHTMFLAVTRDSGRLVHDRGAGAGEAVDERRLAGVREADDRDRPDQADVSFGHGGVSPFGRPRAWTSASQSKSRRISLSISAVASL